jgi:hypothetical protein
MRNKIACTLCCWWAALLLAQPRSAIRPITVQQRSARFVFRISAILG